MTEVPATMRAWVIRPDRLGEPRDAMRLETVETPRPGPGEVVVKVMAAGVNYNNVWACLGQPVAVFRYTGYDFHIGGSDASGIVAAVGPGVMRWQPGDEVAALGEELGETCHVDDLVADLERVLEALELRKPHVDRHLAALEVRGDVLTSARTLRTATCCLALGTLTAADTSLLRVGTRRGPQVMNLERHVSRPPRRSPGERRP